MKRQSLLFYGVYSLISVMAVILITYLSRGNCFYGDDFWFALLRPDFGEFSPLNPFSAIHGSGYLGFWLLTFFCYTLPNSVLNIHPADFIAIPQGIIRGLMAIPVFSVLLLYFRLFSKDKILFLVLYFALITLFIFEGLNSNIIGINYNYYRYFLSLIFCGFFWFCLYKYTMIKTPKTNKLQFFSAVLCAYTTGMASEIEIFLSLSLFCLIIGFNIIISLISKYKEEIKAFKFNLSKEFFILFAVFLTSMTLFITSTGYKEVSADRGMTNISLSLGIIKEYSIIYFQNCFLREWVLWVLIIIFFSFAFYFAKKKNEIKKLIFPLFFLVSLLAVMYSLILCGKTYNDNTYFITHNNVLALCCFLTTIPILMFAGYTFKNIKSKKFKTLFTLFLLISGVVLLCRAKYIQAQYMYLIREKCYIIEKMVLFDYYRSDKILLPFYTIFEYKKELIDDEYARLLYTNYIEKVYHTNKISEREFVFEPDAVEKFYEIGGNFGKQELKKIRYENLKDPDFVLKQQDDKLSEEELEEILKK